MGFTPVKKRRKIGNHRDSGPAIFQHRQGQTFWHHPIVSSLGPDPDSKFEKMAAATACGWGCWSSIFSAEIPFLVLLNDGLILYSNYNFESGKFGKYHVRPPKDWRCFLNPREAVRSKWSRISTIYSMYFDATPKHPTPNSAFSSPHSEAISDSATDRLSSRSSSDLNCQQKVEKSIRRVGFRPSQPAWFLKSPFFQVLHDKSSIDWYRYQDVSRYNCKNPFSHTLVFLKCKLLFLLPNCLSRNCKP